MTSKIPSSAFNHSGFRARSIHGMTVVLLCFNILLYTIPMFSKMKRYYIGIVFTLFASASTCVQSSSAGVGQTIQISTQLESFTGKPSWLLMIRDIDNNENIPYVFDFISGYNYWVAATHGHNYVIIASTLQFAPYKSDPYRTKVIRNFCNLESHGRIAHGESVTVTISGKLSPNTDNYICNVTRFTDNYFGTIPSAE